MPFNWIKTFPRQKAGLPRRQAGLILIFLGLVCFGTIFSFKIYQESRQKILSFSQVPKLTEESPEELFPTQILIPKVRINLPVFAAKAGGEVWEVSDKGVSYLLGSGIPGKGNLVIYGHNKTSLFGPIRWLEKGEEIKVVNKREQEFIYKVVETKTVSPKNVEVLAPTEDATLTLYTCTGFLDSKRFIIVAKL